MVERTLKKEGEIKHRDDLGREELVAKIWEWKEKYGGIIIQQLKKLGGLVRLDAQRFTMDPDYSRCVSQVFVDLYKKGLIYRGKRMVNWCPASLTALCDEEVIMKPQNGMLYLLQGGSGGGARHVAYHRHDAPGDHPRRHRRRRESEGPALRAPHRQTRACVRCRSRCRGASS